MTDLNNPGGETLEFLGGDLKEIARDPSRHVTVIIFGASGDLSRRKLLPALYALHCGEFFSNFSLLGIARSDRSDEVFQGKMKEAVNEFSRLGAVDDDTWESFAKGMRYIGGDLEDINTFDRAREALEEMEGDQADSAIRLFYLAIPPNAFPVTLGNISTAQLSPREHADRYRIIIEKPFGSDIDSAQVLNDQVHTAFDEQQVYRIDHYLGKETVQNILVFRLANGIFEPLWNRRYVDHVEITVGETLGIEDRGEYFDSAGVLRDIVQNHMLQLLCLVGMEVPSRFDADHVRNEKVKVLMSLAGLTEEDFRTSVVRGQYAEGEIGGKQVSAYRYENHVDPQSQTETFVAFRAYLDNWRWAGVPFYLRAGKRMKARTTEITITFKQPPLALFRAMHQQIPEPNKLIIQIQPNEGISLRVGSKRPGTKFSIDPVELKFQYETSFDNAPPEAYERLLLDAINGDSTLFARGDEVHYAWKFITPFHKYWESTDLCPVHPYWSGSWGPDAAERIMHRDGRAWRNEIPGEWNLE